MIGLVKLVKLNGDVTLIIQYYILVLSIPLVLALFVTNNRNRDANVLCQVVLPV